MNLPLISMKALLCSSHGYTWSQSLFDMHHVLYWISLFYYKSKLLSTPFIPSVDCIIHWVCPSYASKLICAPYMPLVGYDLHWTCLFDGSNIFFACYVLSVGLALCWTCLLYVTIVFDSPLILLTTSTWFIFLNSYSSDKVNSLFSALRASRAPHRCRISDSALGLTCNMLKWSGPLFLSLLLWQSKELGAAQLQLRNTFHLWPGYIAFLC